MAEVLKISPQPGPQTEFLSTNADIAIYGGAAGGGKTFALLLEALRYINVPGFSVTFFRRSYPQIKAVGGLWDEAAKIYPLVGGRAKQDTLEYIFPSGNRIKFAHLQHEKTKQEYQGSQIPLIIFDELTHFERSQWEYLFSRNRSVCGVKPYVRASTNPDATSWVADYIGPWVNPNHEVQAESGEILYVRPNDEGMWDYARKGEPGWDHPAAKSLTFIKSSIQDNQILLDTDPGYLANLEGLPLVERQRLLHGDWLIDDKDLLYSTDWFPTIERWEMVQNYNITASVRYWDLAGTTTEDNPRACFTSGVLMHRTSEGVFIIEDIRRCQQKPALVKELIKRTAQDDGTDVTIVQEQEPGSAGIAVIDAYRELLAGFDFRADRVTGSKLTRSKPLEQQAEAGKILLVKAPWNKAFYAEVKKYPHGDKDQVDSAAGALHHVTQLHRFAFW